MKKQKPLGAIVLAAGLGTRMQSRRAKVLHRLGGEPLLAYSIKALRAIGAEPIVVVVGYDAEAVRAAGSRFGVRFATQTAPKGTGDAARCAAAALEGFGGDLMVVYGDLPFLQADSMRRLVEAHRRAGAAVSLLTTEIDDPSGFGRVQRDPQGRVIRIIEQRDASPAERAIREVNVGVYCADSGFLFRALGQLRPTNAQGELYLTDIIEIARRAGAVIGDAQGVPREATQISSRADLAAREESLRQDINSKWLAAGVTLEDPATTYIGPDVVIGCDTIIGPNVILRGATRIGENCRFDGTALITDAQIRNGVHIKFGVVATECVIGDDVEVGPFAQLRTGTRLAAKVRIGDFVETKNAVVGSGTKALHLAYLGDTEIGADSNIGAGTITCNYDGFRKQRTLIGDRVQIGSDTTLVAPVRVADDAYVATATTVRKDVPAGTLAFNSRDQVHRPGWVAARRAREATASAAVVAAKPGRRKLKSPKAVAARPRAKRRSRARP